MLLLQSLQSDEMDPLKKEKKSDEMDVTALVYIIFLYNYVAARTLIKHMHN